MTNTIDTTQFNETKVIKALKSKQTSIEAYPSGETPTQAETPQPSEEPVHPPPKPKRGRKPKYTSDEERIQARRLQQKQYRERRNRELHELRALRETINSNH